MPINIARILSNLKIDLNICIFKNVFFFQLLNIELLKKKKNT